MNGIEDEYLSAGAALKGIGPLDTLGIAAGYHQHDAERIDADYGNELDVCLTAKLRRVNVMLKYADYEQGMLASAHTTEKL